jgi:two-component system, chemotaxis family, protein-glutamate methylesterase/glutaminase
MIRVLVVEDSATVRNRLCEALTADPGIEVAGAAENGHAAVELARTLRPDVITMDIMLPGLDGLAATEHIMAHCPTPILVVSASDNRSEAFTTCAALAAGAVDALDKPTGDIADEVWDRRLRSAVRVVSKVAVITHPRAKLTALRRPPSEPLPEPAPAGAVAPGDGPRLIAIGASTGGPAAVVDLLRAVPPGIGVPILLVQHIGAAFADSYVEWLDGQSPHPVRCARDGERVPPGRVTVAPGDRHLTVRDGRLRLDDGPERHSCRPSVDTLFESVALAHPGAAAGCLLTGMGRDGAAGLHAMRRAGCRTFAQDEASSVVYGMPREAVLLGAVDEVLPPADIGRRLAALTPARSR